jgi:transposase
MGAPYRLTKKQRDAVPRVYAEGNLTYKDLAGMYGCSEGTIGAIVRDTRTKQAIINSEDPIEPFSLKSCEVIPRPGSGRPKYKMDPQKEDEICKLYLQGTYVKRLMKTYDVTSATIYNVLRNHGITPNRKYKKLAEKEKKEIGEKDKILRAKKHELNDETEVPSTKKISSSETTKGIIKDVLDKTGNRSVSGILILFE